MFQNYKNSRAISQDMFTQTKLTYQNQNKRKEALAKKLLDLGNLFLEKKQFGTAIDLFTLSDYFGNQSALLLKARVLFKQGEHFKAFCCLRMIIARSYEKTEFTEYLREFDTRQKLLILSACIDAYLPLNVDYSDTTLSFAEIEHFLTLQHALKRLSDIILSKEYQNALNNNKHLPSINTISYFILKVRAELCRRQHKLQEAQTLSTQARQYNVNAFYALSRHQEVLEKEGNKGSTSYYTVQLF